jgi:hypothetical protein
VNAVREQPGDLAELGMTLRVFRLVGGIAERLGEAADEALGGRLTVPRPLVR